MRKLFVLLVVLLLGNVCFGVVVPLYDPFAAHIPDDINVGTVQGQMLYWEPNSWTPTTDLLWNETTDTLTIGGSSPLYNIVDDTTPELGGDLDGQQYSIDHIVDMNMSGDFSLKGQILADYGTEALPGISFDGDPDTGIRRSGNDTMEFVTNETDRLRISSAGIIPYLPIRFLVGTEALPGITFSGDTDTGIRRSAADMVAIVTGGIDRIDVNTTSIRLNLPLDMNNSTIVDIADGSEAAPGVSFHTNAGTGWWLGQGYSLRGSVAGTEKFRIDTSGLDFLGWNAIDVNDIEIKGNIWDGSDSLTVANAKSAYDHSQDNSQAHTDYLLNNASDETSGTLTAAGFTTTGVTASGMLDLLEIAQPAKPATNTLRIYAEAIQGFSFLKYLDDTGATGMKREFMRDSMLLAYNNSGSTIAAARIVYADSNTATVPTIKLAKADAIATMPAIGVTVESIANGAYGRVMQIGVLEGVNTSALSAGDILYVSDATAGVPVTTVPTTPSLTQEIGTVLVDNATTGSIQIVARGLTGDEHGTAQNTFTIGDGSAGTKSLIFNAATNAQIDWTETEFDFGANNLKTTGLLTDGTKDLSIADANAAYVHISESGASHSYIDQDVTSGSAPTFSADNFSNGGSNVIVTTTQETNWDNHIADSSQAHSDYLVNNANDTTTGVLTMTGINVNGDANIVLDDVATPASTYRFHLDGTTNPIDYTDLDTNTRISQRFSNLIDGTETDITKIPQYMVGYQFRMDNDVNFVGDAGLADTKYMYGQQNAAYVTGDWDFTAKASPTLGHYAVTYEATWDDESYIDKSGSKGGVALSQYGSLFRSVGIPNMDAGTRTIDATFIGGEFAADQSGTPTLAGTITTEFTGGNFKGYGYTTDNTCTTYGGRFEAKDGDNNYGAQIKSISTAGTLNVGLQIGAISGATDNYSIRSNGGQSYHAGDLRIGSTTAPLSALHMGNDKLIAVDVDAGITASTTQSQGQGALTAQVNEISTVANKDDTVTLPSAITGIEIEIINNGVNTLLIFPASGDDLGLGLNTAEELEANERVKFVAYDTTNWAKESTTEIMHAEIHDGDNTDAFVINDAGADFHSYHTNGFAAGDLANWAFDVGGAGTSHAITGIADAGGGDITVTTGDAHLLAVGDIISQTNLTDVNYVGVFDVLTVPTSTTYTVTAAYTATGTGTMDQAATLEANAVAAGVYSFAYYISATPVGNNETFDFQLYKEAAVITGSKIRRKFGAGGDFGSMSGGGVVAVADGDKISFALSNEDSAANLIIRNLTIVLIRL